MRDPATLPAWKRTCRAFSHRADKCVLVWNSLAQGTYNVGNNKTKAERRAKWKASRAIQVVLYNGRKAPKLKGAFSAKVPA